jgi:spermidine synthase
MIPWVQLDKVRIPDGGELRLMQRGAEFSIMAGAITLMNNRQSGSEKALASLCCERLGGRSGQRMLIGGLGMGFTLRAALAGLPAEAEIVVAELLPAVVAWARGPLAHIFDGSLADPRVTIHEADVAHVIANAPRGAFDAILLDVDNGPGGLNRAANDRIYTMAGLTSARAALRSGGILAIWSVKPDNAFVQRLRRSGYAVEEVRVRARETGRGAMHIVWLATPR